ncbi:N-acetylmuramoyl-L-alanine amidase [Aeromicrobium sp.]|uniref:N-acetylmuramoyl-L-alanine amidase n=1 Tax=Aeromicrobium sp. TaxID=1871063 RepID=UPI002FC927E7
MTRRTPAQYDWAALEFDETILTKHFTSLSSRTIRFVVVHHMTIVGSGTGSALTACYNVWQNREASAHYGVDGNLVRQFVWDKDRAWSTGSSTGNQYGISIEHANSTAGPQWLVADNTWKTGARLAAHLHKTYKLGRPVSGVTLRKHSSFTATACPGPYLGSTAWGKYVAECQRVYDSITGATPAPTPDVQEPVPAPIPTPTAAPVWGQPSTWRLGAVGPDALRLGERITAWNTALGLPTWTPDDNFSSTERNALQKLQVAWGFGSSAADLAPGGASDGYPGALTFAKLDETPAPIAVVEPATKVTGLHWNIAGSDIHNGYKAENGTRGDDVARHALDIGFEVFLTCEASQSDLRAGMNTVIGNLSPWMRRAKGIWHKPSAPRLIGRRAYSDSIYAYLSTLKWGGAFFGIKDGKKYAFLEIHTDYRAPAKQAGQVRSITAKFWADTDALGIPRENTVIAGDFNWDGTSGDNPFKALEAYEFVEKGNRTIATFLNGRHLDGVIAHKDADVTVTRQNRWNTRGVKLSDHYPLKFVITLK